MADAPATLPAHVQQFLGGKEAKEQVFDARIEIARQERLAMVEPKHQIRYPMLKQITFQLHAYISKLPKPKDLTKEDWQKLLDEGDRLKVEITNQRIPNATLYEATAHSLGNGQYDYIIIDPNTQRAVARVLPAELEKRMERLEFLAEENRFIDAENEVMSAWEFYHELFSLAGVWMYNSRWSPTPEGYGEARRQENAATTEQNLPETGGETLLQPGQASPDGTEEFDDDIASGDDPEEP